VLHSPLLLALALAPRAQAGAVVSSFKPETQMGANTYNAQAAIDGKLDTAWQVPGESKNVGEFIVLDVPKTTLDKVGLDIGWDDSEKRFFDYARVKTLTVEVTAYDENQDLVPVGTATVSFEDKRGMQVVDIPDIAVGTDLFGGKVKLTVTEIYPGKDYPNLAVSEVLLHMAEFDAAAKIVDISSEDAGHTRDSLIDDNDKTFWTGSSKDASITFGADGFSLAEVGLRPVSKDYDRLKKVRLTANDRSSEIDLPDSLDEQWMQIPAVVGFTGSAWGDMKIEVLETWPGTKSPGKLGLKELDLKATAFEGL